MAPIGKCKGLKLRRARVSIRPNTWCWSRAISKTTPWLMTRCLGRYMMRRMTMETRAKTKWQIRSAVLIIFVIGFVAGALAMNFYRSRLVASSSESMRGGRFERVFDQLNLTPDQKNSVRAIFDEARAQLNEVR